LVDLPEGTANWRRLAVAHAAEERPALVALLRAARPDPSVSSLVSAALDAGTGLVAADAPDDVLAGLATFTNVPAVMRAGGLRSVIAVPLPLGGERPGLLTLATASS